MPTKSLIWFISSCVVGVAGHGYLLSPRSKQAYSREYGRGSWDRDLDLWPAIDFATASSLMGGDTYGVCGRIEGNDYIDYTYNWLTADGNHQMPWTQVEEYVEGEKITIETVIRANHRGFFEIGLCVMDSDTDIPTQDCFDSNKLTLVEDVLYGSPVHEDYPTRAHYPPDNFPKKPGYSGPKRGGQELKKDGLLTRHTFQLPAGVHGEYVYLQWHWISYFGCFMPGWDTYAWPKGWDGDTLGYTGIHAAICDEPLPDSGNNPQQYWQCAQVKIAKANTRSPRPSPAPITPAPVDHLYCCAPKRNFQQDCIQDPHGGKWCQESQDNCEWCDGVWVDVYNPPTCSSWWSEDCERGPNDNCCKGSKCTPTYWGSGKDQYWLSCLPK